MKKLFFYRIIIIMLFIIFMLNIKSNASSDFEYELDSNNNATITAYKGNDTSIIIPNSIEGYAVKSIGTHSFHEEKKDTNGKQLINVTISEGITIIDDFAFIKCSSLENVTLPESLNYLGSMAFLNCNKLTKINIPSNLKKLGTFAFQETAFTEFTIPNGVEIIQERNFRLCKQLKTFKVYSKDVEYEENVFEYCSEDLILYGYEGSTTQAYAQQYGLKFKLLDDENKGDIKEEVKEEKQETELIPVTSISLSEKSLSLYIGDTRELGVTILPNNATDKTIIWSSRDSNIASIEDGNIIAKSMGETMIFASTLDGKVKANCNVIVLKKESDIKDNTIASAKLPQTGLNYIVLSLIIIINIIMFVIYKHYIKSHKFY